MDSFERRAKALEWLNGESEMTKEEALDLLGDAPKSSTAMSKVNKNFTQLQVAEIIENAIRDHKDGSFVSLMMEKRVWQVYKNQRRPKY